MIAFLKKLWLTQYAHVDLCRDLIRVLGLMFVIPPADRLNALLKIEEELASGCTDVPAEDLRIISPAEQYEMVHLQERFKPVMAEQVEVLRDHRIEKFVGRDHVFPHRVGKIITPAIEHRIDRREVMLHIAQLSVDASEAQAQAQSFHFHVQQ